MTMMMDDDDKNDGKKKVINEKMNDDWMPPLPSLLTKKMMHDRPRKTKFARTRNG